MAEAANVGPRNFISYKLRTINPSVAISFTKVLPAGLRNRSTAAIESLRSPRRRAR